MSDLDLGGLADEVAIRNLVAVYCDGVNRRDAATWASVWADDGAAWDLAGRVIEGKDAIVAFWVIAVAAYDWLQQVASTGVVQVGGDTATGRWFVQERGRLQDGTARSLLATYHDRYVRTEAGWRIQHRRLEVVAAGDDAR